MLTIDDRDRQAVAHDLRQPGQRRTCKHDHIGAILSHRAQGQITEEIAFSSCTSVIDWIAPALLRKVRLGFTSGVQRHSVSDALAPF
ncbi:hypothetical protein E2L08_16545 [Palleronia sediminis]|uniref:Uncharacterized protein n=1 Tax=Palleronia sediminis TaxID=2547833 RepID=A0A4R5ZV66_9RHOB|nr:hypothetical protein [Palleronia sediminis]TDL74144.1 hypothetical protein E2L08_16545 [Palleronia sediminis]